MFLVWLYCFYSDFLILSLFLITLLAELVLLKMITCMQVSGVARAFPGRRVAQPESQNEEENGKSLRKNKKH